MAGTMKPWPRGLSKILLGGPGVMKNYPQGPRVYKKLPQGPQGLLKILPQGPKTLKNLGFPHRDRKNLIKTSVFRIAIANTLGKCRFLAPFGFPAWKCSRTRQGPAGTVGGGGGQAFRPPRSRSNDQSTKSIERRGARHLGRLQGSPH